MGWHYVVRFKWDVDGMMGVGCYLTCASLNDLVQALRRAHNHTIFHTRFRYTPCWLLVSPGRTCSGGLAAALKYFFIVARIELELRQRE